MKEKGILGLTYVDTMSLLLLLASQITFQTASAPSILLLKSIVSPNLCFSHNNKH
jgi:hypothetical protein